MSTKVSASECVPIGEALLPKDGTTLDYVSLIRKVQRNPIVLLGEHHDNISHHRWQLQMITGLHTLNPKLVLGFEMFPRKVQPVLDRWIAGELSEEELLKQANWSEYWRFDPLLYIPIFQYARMNKIPMLALNVERSLVRSVGKEGWSAVSVDEKEGVSQPAPPSDGYREMLAGVFMQHGQHHGSDKTNQQILADTMAMPGFTKFVESQQVWDRAMAEAIVNAAKSHGESQVVALMGSGHMMYGFGVPEQLADLGAAKPSILIPWDPEFKCSYIQPDFADAVIGLVPMHFSDQEKEQKHPRIGIYLEKHDKGVLVTRVLEGSVGEAINVQKGDVIVEMAGQKVSEVADVIEIVQQTRFGTWLPFTVDRNDKQIELVAKFPAEE